MGLLGLRKFIDSCGCTRLLPVPLSDAEAEEEARRRLRLEGYREVAENDAVDNGNGSATAAGLYGRIQAGGDEEDEDGVYDGDDYEAAESGTTGRGAASAGRRHLTSSSHVGAAGGSAVPQVDHVLVDMNCIVHSCFFHQSSENKPKKQLIQEVLERLRVLVTEVVVPRQSLSICFDGPAPIAKLQTQRLRRRKVSLLDTGSVHQLNTLSITAGSLFMIELENAIASQFKLNHGRGFLRRACPVYLYGTTVMGEGEAKIARALAFLAYGPGCSPDGGEGAASSAGPEETRGGRGGRGGRGQDRFARGSSAPPQTSRDRAAAPAAAAALTPFARCRPNDTVVVMGNDIDLVVTCLGATAFHNFSIVSPSSLQLIRVSDILFRWLKATSATRGDTPFAPAQLPSIRIDFIFLFLLNGGDHYTGAGEVAMGLWRRYRSVRATYPDSTLVSPNLDAIDIDFLADLVQASEYTGSSSIEVGMDLLKSALWSLYTVVTGVCPDYHYVPAPAAPQLCHLRAAAAHCQRTNTRIRMPSFKADSKPLTPLETYVALMPTEATLPKSVVAGLHSRAANQPILTTLETSNDTTGIAQAAQAAVAVAAPFLTTSEQYLRQFTSPVQLNVNPPRRRLSRHEQHRMLATHGQIRLEDPVPVVKPIVVPEGVPYMQVPYPSYTTHLDFFCPFDVATSAAEEDADGAGVAEAAHGAANGVASLTHLHGRTVSTRSIPHSAAVEHRGGGGKGAAAHAQRQGSARRAPNADAVEHKRVYLNQEAAAAAAQRRERESAAAKLQRTLDLTSTILERGQHFTTPQQRRMHRRLHRLQQAETAELRRKLAAEDRRYAARAGNGGATDGDLEAELRSFLGSSATPADIAALMDATAVEREGGEHDSEAASHGVRRARKSLRSGGRRAEAITQAAEADRAGVPTQQQQQQHGGGKSKKGGMRNADVDGANCESGAHTRLPKKRNAESRASSSSNGHALRATPSHAEDAADEKPRRRRERELNGSRTVSGDHDSASQAPRKKKRRVQ